MRSIAGTLVVWVALAAGACDKKNETPPAPSAAPSSAASASQAAAKSVDSNGASASASSSAATAHPGACKQMLAEKAKRCDAMAKGDPTIEQACKEAIDRLSSAGDDGRCWTAMNPPDVGPPQDDVPE